MAQPDETIKKIKILIVDDMEAMRTMVKGVLRDLGAEHISMAANGDFAWRKLNDRKIDFIICDWDMPEVTGLEVLQRVRSSESHCHIPFLMLTAANEKERVVKAVEAGVNDYLAKPFQPKELAYRVVKLLRKVDLNGGVKSSNANADTSATVNANEKGAAEATPESTTSEKTA